MMDYLYRVALTERTSRMRRWFRWDRDGDTIRDVARAVVALDVECAIASGRRHRRPTTLPSVAVRDALRVLVLAKEANLIATTPTAVRLGDTTGGSFAILGCLEEAQNPPRMTR